MRPRIARSASILIALKPVKTPDMVPSTSQWYHTYAPAISLLAFGTSFSSVSSLRAVTTQRGILFEGLTMLPSSS